MDRTPKNRLSCSVKNKNLYVENVSSSTRVNIANTFAVTPQNKLSCQQQLESDYSPIYFQSTQEAFNDMDVMWDWNSPKSNKNLIGKKTHKHNAYSPKIAMKKHPSNNQIQTFDELKTEMEALKNKLVYERDCRPSVKGCLVFDDSLFYDDTHKLDKDNLHDLEALFEDDSVDEELLLCSQKVEDNILKKNNISCEPMATKSTFHKVKSDNQLNNSTVKNISTVSFKTTKSNNELTTQFKAKNLFLTTNYDDSFELALKNLKEDNFDLKKGNARTDMNKFTDIYNKQTPKQLKRNFNNNLNDEFNHDFRICNVEEIKRKKMEALAKLQARKNKGNNSTKSISESDEKITQTKGETSILKCSPKEIEQKRLQALAKLKAKNLENIERNRQEALKRLEMNKKKRAMDLQHSLISKSGSR